jgi:hypothetical protein
MVLFLTGLAVGVVIGISIADVKPPQEPFK